MILYRITSSLRICSATSPGGVPKSACSETTRERSTSTLFPTTMDSFRMVSEFTSKKAWSNFVVRIKSRGSPKERFEMTEPTRALLRDVGVTNGSLERFIPEVLL